MNMKNKLIKILVPIISIVCSFIVGAILIASIGGDPVEAFSYLLKGAFGTTSNIGETFVKATPLIFTGLAATFAYKCGVFNLGAEGQFVMGAVASVWVSTTFLSVPAPLLLVLSLTSGVIAGGLWGLIPGILKIKRGLNEMIVSIMLNYIAVLFMGYLYSGPLRDGNLPQTAEVAVKLGRIFSGTRVHAGILIALVLTFVLYYFLFHTSFGFKLRAVGLNPTAAEYNGFPLKKLMLASFVISGAIAGLGGSVELHGTQFRLMSGFGVGYGFDGVAIALIGQLNPIGTVLVAYLFAVLRKGAITMQVGTGMPTSVIDIIQALVIVFAVAGSALTNLPKVKQFFTNISQKSKKEVE
ncbi:ABC transporter permease [[Clostridium] fimetarium]|uniref:Simple sugar transport system permease protein n=1 Tax=[Clostridium] fimetarium TaxID=99656 RepID=A0A1I0RAJ0_9FIRM|nr:ABC transporter permease [[Clostridium] fimetarium]SEW37728.1 simple sugar transport system permease protein [[Clostridium] fimetarium]